MMVEMLYGGHTNQQVCYTETYAHTHHKRKDTHTHISTPMLGLFTNLLFDSIAFVLFFTGPIFISPISSHILSIAPAYNNTGSQSTVHSSLLRLLKLDMQMLLLFCFPLQHCFACLKLLQPGLQAEATTNTQERGPGGGQS